MKYAISITILLLLFALAIVSADDTESFTLNSNDKKTKEISLEGNKYTFTFVSGDENSATLKVEDKDKESETLLFQQGSKEDILDLLVELTNVNDTNGTIYAEIEAILETVESSNTITFDLIESPKRIVKYNGTEYIVTLFTAHDNAATFIVENQNNKSKTQEMEENTLENILGLEIKLISADENFQRIIAEVEISADEIINPTPETPASIINQTDEPQANQTEEPEEDDTPSPDQVSITAYADSLKNQTNTEENIVKQGVISRILKWFKGLFS